MQLFRPPHGTPFIRADADTPRVASVVRRHAVTVLWTFGGNPTLDWDCDTNVQCVLNSYLSWFQSGTSGIPLMHAVKAGTAGGVSHGVNVLMVCQAAHACSASLGPTMVCIPLMHAVKAGTAGGASHGVMP